MDEDSLTSLSGDIPFHPPRHVDIPYVVFFSVLRHADFQYLFIYSLFLKFSFDFRTYGRHKIMDFYAVDAFVCGASRGYFQLWG